MRSLIKDLSKWELRNISPDRKGIGVFTNKKVEVGSDITLILQDVGPPYEARGQVRWRAGDRTPEGNIRKTQFYGNEIVEEDFGYESLVKCFGPIAAGYEYAIGIQLNTPIPPYIYPELQTS